MTEFFMSGRVVDGIVVVLVAEALLLLAYRTRTGRGLGPRELLPMLGAGLFLLLGWRASSAALAWPWIAACLSLAFVAHLVDLRSRLRPH